MLYIFTGTDRNKARAAMQKEIAHVAKGAEIVRITDAHTPADFSASLQGGGMFGGARVVVFENVLAHDGMGPLFFDALPQLSESNDPFFLFEEKVDAAGRKRVEKYAKTTAHFDTIKRARDNQVFDLAYALQRGDKKNLWVGYLREIAKGSAPEMVHGILFWAAKQHFLKTREGTVAHARAEKLLTQLVELPHEARRGGFDMEYALEHFVLSQA